jgi:hypothetical protein
LDSKYARNARAGAGRGRQPTYISEFPSTGYRRAYRQSSGYRSSRPRQRTTGPRPDRVAAWAVVLGFLLILLAGATSRADTTGGASAPAPPAAAPGSGGATPGQAGISKDLQAKLAAAPVSIATWYGPGFFGRRTACGQLLRRSTQGVAHKRLPCGTEVTVYYRGRIKTVPVIDRGPFVRRATWDLTQATARDLGIDRTSRVRVLH